MHDCEQTKERLLDLAFGELGPVAGERVRLEMENCPRCLAQYQAMTETLHAFEQVAEAEMPDENYWPGYEARLQSRLQQERPTLHQRLSGWLGWIGELRMLTTPRRVPLAAGLLLLLLITGWWNWQRRQVGAPAPASETAKTESTSRPVLEPQSKEVANAPKLEETAINRKPVATASLRPHNKARLFARTAPRGASRETLVAAATEAEQVAQLAPINSLFDPETARHFEQAQLLLRSFRNAGRNAGVTKPAERRAPVELTYEKEWSRRLLYQNILLRRDAEAKGNLPAEESLSSLEPFLLDIANLPDKPTPDALNGIKQRLQRRDLIAALQIYAAQPAWPADQNQ